MARKEIKSITLSKEDINYVDAKSKEEKKENFSAMIRTMIDFYRKHLK